MNFIKALRADYDARVKPRVQQRNTLRDSVAGCRRQIETEEHAQEGIEHQLDSLEHSIGAALAEGEGSDSYSRIEIALESARAEEGRIAKRLERLRALLPTQQEALEEAEKRLNEARTLVARENLVALAQAEVDRHIRAILDLYDGWVIAHMALAAEDGDGFTPPQDTRPSIKGERIHPDLWSLIAELPSPEYAQLAKQQAEGAK